MSRDEIAADDPRAVAGREELVRRLVAHGRLNDPSVADAMLHVPRHQFVEAPLAEAYRDRILGIGHAQTLSQPSVVAWMTEALEIAPGDCVLEIGTGSGYQAAILAALAHDVFTIEIVPALGEAARARLAALGVRNVHVRIGDGHAGWPAQAPFDRVILTAAPPELPAALIEQLRVGGVLVAPVGEGRDQRLVRIRKTSARLVREDLGAVRFVPMTGGPDRD